MSAFNREYRKIWVDRVYERAVHLFREAREYSENKDIPLVDLARQSANSAFQEHAPTIIGDKEIVARAFMAKCRESFPKEINNAIASKAQEAVAVQMAKAS